MCMDIIQLYHCGQIVHCHNHSSPLLCLLSSVISFKFYEGQALLCHIYTESFYLLLSNVFFHAQSSSSFSHSTVDSRRKQENLELSYMYARGTRETLDRQKLELRIDTKGHIIYKCNIILKNIQMSKLVTCDLDTKPSKHK